MYSVAKQQIVSTDNMFFFIPGWATCCDLWFWYDRVTRYQIAYRQLYDMLLKMLGM